MSEWEHLDDSDGEASGFFSDLGQAWAEALLSVDLSRQERKSWAKRLTKWQEGLDDYGVDDAFAVAAAAGTDRGSPTGVARFLPHMLPLDRVREDDQQTVA